jgi:hypothetical protein
MFPATLSTEIITMRFLLQSSLAAVAGCVALAGLQHGDTIELGGTAVTLLHHPGHTKGASSFTFTTQDGGRDYEVLIVNIGSINDGVKLLGMELYPEIASDYATTVAAQKRRTSGGPRMPAISICTTSTKSETSITRSDSSTRTGTGKKLSLTNSSI